MKLLHIALTLAVSASVAGSLGCAAKPRQRPIPTTDVDTGAGTTAAARKFLQGRWSLMSFEVYPPGDKPFTVTGAGTLTYDDFGNLAIEIRADEAGAALLQKAGIVTQQPGVVSTTGRTVIDMPGKKLTYIIDGQAPTAETYGLFAMSRPRYWQVDGDVLTLTTRDDAGNPLTVGKWKRQP